MLLRRELDRTIAITQPRHAWLAGELAQAWGGAGFHVPEPRDALVCAVALHDIGWLDWERAPQLDTDTGLPLTFDKVAATVHTRLWQAGVEAAEVYGPLPALHVSRHGMAIYDLTFDRDTARREQVEAVDSFVARQTALQAATIARLGRDPDIAPWVSAEHLELTRAFILAVDTLSLQLCRGVGDVARVRGVPHQAGAVDLELKRHSNDQVTIDPWPFASGQLTVVIEGKVIEPVRDQNALDRLLSEAKTTFQLITLLPRLRCRQPL